MSDGLNVYVSISTNPTNVYCSMVAGIPGPSWTPTGNLALIQALTLAADKLIYATAADAVALATITTFARTLIDDADSAAARTTLGLVIGTNVQAYNANLAALAGLTLAANKLPYATGEGALALADLTTFARTLLDDVDAAAARSTLGLGTMATAAATDYVAKALFDANTILAANSDNTPAAVTVAEDRILGRKAGGNISALTGAEAAAIVGTSGELVQVVNTITGAVATGTTAIPDDDTIPQKTEGDEYMTVSITPKNVSNKLLILVVWNGSRGTAVSGAVHITAALFQDTTANALAVARAHEYSVHEPVCITFAHYMTAGTTSETTFKVRAGYPDGATTTFNGSNTARKYGGVLASSITVFEIAA